MKILYFHQHFTTRAGSTGTRSYEMARALLASGHEVHMVCGNFQVANSGLSGSFTNGVRAGTVDGIRITEFDIPYANSDGFVSRVLAFLKFAWRAVKVALTDNYDLVFATSTPLTAGIPGIAAKVLRRKKFIFEVRDLWPEIPREMGVIKNPIILGAMSVLEWVTYRAADGCIGLAPGMVEGIKRRSPKGQLTAMIPNGCDVDLFHKSDDPTTSQINAESTQKPFTAIFSGAHGKANGLNAVLDAAAVLKQRGIDHIRIEFIGNGSEKPRLIQRAEAEGLVNCVFLASMAKTDLVFKLQQVDVGLMVLDNVPAFYFGTSPNKFFDYIASGLPVLNNYPGWVAGIVAEDNLGLVVPEADPIAFADALITMAENPAMLRQMSDNSVTCAFQRFNRTELAREFVLFLESVYQGRSIVTLHE